MSSTAWSKIRDEAARSATNEPILASFLNATILNHESIEAALSFHLANILESPTLPAISLREIIHKAYLQNEKLIAACWNDLTATYERDPVCQCYSTPFLYFKGFHALQSYRISHHLWQENRQQLALFFQNRTSTVLGVDIHPAAKIGSGLLIDHATGIVVGETAVIDDDVSMLHSVTLGGTGNQEGDRHPKVGKGVLIGAGAKVLGNVTIGPGAKIAAGSVVLHSVAAHTTVAGVPAQPIGQPKQDQPALWMDQSI